MNDLQHLQPAFRHYAMLSSEERASWIRQDRWIGYPRADQILKRLQELLSYPPRDRMPCLLLFGATGMGKTRIVQKFLRDNRSSFDEITGTTRVPVAAIQMPPTPWERDFYEELLIGLGTVLPAGMSSTALRHRSRTAARQLKVRMLIIDEITRCWLEPFVSSAFSLTPFVFWPTIFAYRWSVQGRTKRNKRS